MKMKENQFCMIYQILKKMKSTTLLCNNPLI
jgi:hypothetical protein